jgi:hypothetical protein
MGKSDTVIKPFYKKHITQKGTTALLGFTDNKTFEGDLYDLSLGWDINSKWELSKRYDTIICTRCAYFCKNPLDFMDRCHKHLNGGGTVYVDWGLGDHWRFKNFKIGWEKDGEHEYAYGENNLLWSVLWDEDFLKIGEVRKFQNFIKPYGYGDLHNAVLNEFPIIFTHKVLKSIFDIDLFFLSTKKPYVQMYVLLKGVKK